MGAIQLAVILSLPAGLGFLAGLARLKWRLAPLIATGVTIVAFCILLIVVGAWVVDCRECYFYDGARPLAFVLALTFGGVYTVVTLAVIWFGAGLAALFRPPPQAKHDH